MLPFVWFMFQAFWPSVKGELARKLFWDNAARCFKQT